MDDDWIGLRVRDSIVRRQDTSGTGTSTSAAPTSSAPPPPPPPPQSSTSAPPSVSIPISTPSSTRPSTSSLPISSIPPSISQPPITTSNRVTTSDGNIVTLTLTQSPTPSPPPPEVTKGFFQNKAAMGATFAVAGLAAVVLIFALITTCIRRRRARKFDRDVAEAAAAAAREAEAADPFIQEEEARMAGNWKNPVNPHGYGKLDEDPYGYVPAGVAGAGYGLHSQYPQHHGDAYGMSNLGNPQQQSMYSGTSSTQYGSNPGGAAYYMNDPNDFGRAPSVATNYTGPGFAGVGSGVPNHPVYYNGAAAYDNSHLRYRGQQLPPGSAEDAYGGYTLDTDRYPNPNAAAMYNPVPPPVPPKNSAPTSRTSASNIGTPSAEGSTSPLKPTSPRRMAQSEVPNSPGEPRVLKVANE